MDPSRNLKVMDLLLRKKIHIYLASIIRDVLEPSAQPQEPR